MLMMLGFPVVAFAAVWLVREWAKGSGRSPSRWGWNVALICVAYYGMWAYAFVQSLHHYGPSSQMLERTRAELKRMGTGKSVGLGGNGAYAGCRVLLLEHFFFDCFSLRTGEEDGLSPETIRDAVQAACATDDCPYQGWFRLSILYMGAPRQVDMRDGGLPATVREQAGTYRFTLKGGKP